MARIIRTRRIEREARYLARYGVMARSYPTRDVIAITQLAARLAR